MALKYHVALEGNPWHLWGLSKLFDGNNPDHTLVKAEEPQGPYSSGATAIAMLTSDHLVFEWNDKEMTSRTSAFIYQINGIARLNDPTFEPVRFIRMTGSGDGHSGALAVSYNEAPPQRLLELPGGDEQGQYVSDLCRLAYDVPAVQFILEAMKLDSNWASLWIIYETIRHAEGEDNILISKGYVTRSELKDFKKAANNSRSIAQGARHGLKSEPVENFNLRDGRRIVMRLVHRWLKDLRANLAQPQAASTP